MDLIKTRFIVFGFTLFLSIIVEIAPRLSECQPYIKYTSKTAFERAFYHLEFIDAYLDYIFNETNDVCTNANIYGPREWCLNRTEEFETHVNQNFRDYFHCALYKFNSFIKEYFQYIGNACASKENLIIQTPIQFCDDLKDEDSTGASTSGPANQNDCGAEDSKYDDSEHDDSEYDGNENHDGGEYYDNNDDDDDDDGK